MSTIKRENLSPWKSGGRCLPWMFWAKNVIHYNLFGVKTIPVPSIKRNRKQPSSCRLFSEEASNSFGAKKTCEKSHVVSCSWSRVSYFVGISCFRMLLSQTEDVFLAYVKHSTWLLGIADARLQPNFSRKTERGCFVSCSSSVWTWLMYVSFVPSEAINSTN